MGAIYFFYQSKKMSATPRDTHRLHHILLNDDFDGVSDNEIREQIEWEERIQPQSKTLLRKACTLQKPDFVKRLVRLGANPLLTGYENASALAYCIAQNATACFDVMWDEIEPSVLESFLESHGPDLLYIALEHKQEFFVKRIIRTKPDLLSRKNENGLTPLHVGVMHDYREFLHDLDDILDYDHRRYLLTIEMSIDPNWTPVTMAQEYNRNYWIREFQRWQRDTDIVQEAFERESVSSYEGSDGSYDLETHHEDGSPFHAAIRRGYTGYFYQNFDYNMSVTTRHHDTVFHTAVRYNRKHMIMHGLMYGPDVALRQNDRGDLPLHMAVRKPSISMAIPVMLMQLPVELWANVRNNEGHTPLDIILRMDESSERRRQLLESMLHCDRFLTPNHFEFEAISRAEGLHQVPRNHQGDLKQLERVIVSKDYHELHIMLMYKKGPFRSSESPDVEETTKDWEHNFEYGVTIALQMDDSIALFLLLQFDSQLRYSTPETIDRHILTKSKTISSVLDYAIVRNADKCYEMLISPWIHDRIPLLFITPSIVKRLIQRRDTLKLLNLLKLLEKHRHKIPDTWKTSSLLGVLMEYGNIRPDFVEQMIRLTELFHPRNTYHTMLPVIKAIQRDHVDYLRMLHEQYPTILDDAWNSLETANYSCVEAALRWDRLECFNYIVRHSDRLWFWYAKQSSRLTALIVEKRGPWKEVLEEQGFHFTFHHEQKSLYRAIAQGDFIRVCDMFNQRSELSNLYYFDEEDGIVQETPLLYACRMNQTQIVHLLLLDDDLLVHVHVRDARGNSPMMHAIWNNNKTIIDFLYLNTSQPFVLTREFEVRFSENAGMEWFRRNQNDPSYVRESFAHRTTMAYIIQRKVFVLEYPTEWLTTGGHVLQSLMEISDYVVNTESVLYPVHENIRAMLRDGTISIDNQTQMTFLIVLGVSYIEEMKKSNRRQEQHMSEEDLTLVQRQLLNCGRNAQTQTWLDYVYFIRDNWSTLSTAVGPHIAYEQWDELTEFGLYFLERVHTIERRINHRHDRRASLEEYALHELDKVVFHAVALGKLYCQQTANTVRTRYNLDAVDMELHQPHKAPLRRPPSSKRKISSRSRTAPRPKPSPDGTRARSRSRSRERRRRRG